MEEVKYRCIYVREWPCYIESEELPLEVCRVCLDAKKIYFERERTGNKNEENKLF